MMKMIMPIARPATVSVSQVLGEPMKGSTSSASAGTRARGFQSKSRVTVLMPGLLACHATSAHLLHF
ncbi:hypothetical protein D3C71_1771660 [compost metagenome]